MSQNANFETEDILPMIFRFLVKAGYKKAAIALQKQAEADLSVVVSFRTLISSNDRPFRFIRRSWPRF